jgi:DNA-binding response OmpR family regulator
LVADDEDTGRLLLAEAAAAAGFDPLVFDNGADALRAALAHDIAIALLDVEMPGMNGFDVCQSIRSAKPMSLPIVIVTGRDDKTAINRAFDAGATDFIAKPVNWSLLPHRLAYVLRNAERRCSKPFPTHCGCSPPKATCVGAKTSSRRRPPVLPRCCPRADSPSFSRSLRKRRAMGRHER